MHFKQLALGAIHIIRDTLGEGGGGTAGLCHQISQGGGREKAKVPRVIFSKKKIVPFGVSA
jgi:hypothetical protein